MKPVTRFLIELLLRWDKTIQPEMRINIQDALYNIKEREMVRPLVALRMIGCSRPTLKKYVQKGWIREIRISYTNRFYDKADIDRLIQYGPPKQ